MKSPVVDEERMSPGHWLGLVVCVPFSGGVMVVVVQCFDTDGWVAEGHPAHKNPIPVICGGSFPEQMEEEVLTGID